MKRKTPVGEHMDHSPIKQNLPSEDEVKEIERKRNQETGRELITQAAARTKKDIAEAHKPVQQMFSFMPYEMTCTAPFYIMSRHEMANRPDEPRHSTWGNITQISKGPKLGIYDETIFLILLAAAVEKGSSTFLITQYEICKLAGVKRSVRAYNAIWNAIENLVDTTIKFHFKKKGKVVRKNIGHLLEYGDWDLESGKLLITFSEFFLQLAKDDSPTYIDVKYRSTLKGDVTKGLYRFYRSQKIKNTYHILKLCNQIHLDTERLPMYKLRDRIKRALRELKSKRFLVRWSISKSDKVSVEKNIHYNSHFEQIEQKRSTLRMKMG